MAKQLTQIDLLALPGLNAPASGFVSFGAKTDGLYQKVGTVETKLATINDTVANSTKLNNQLPSYYLDWNNFANKPDFLLKSGGVMTGSIGFGGTDLNLATARLSGTGTLDIKLPNSNIMGVFYIDLYVYNTCVGTLICQFYTYYPSAINFAGSNSVAWLGRDSSIFGSVRYVTIGTDNYAERHIYIGNTSTAWGSFLSVNIRSVVNFGESALRTSPPTISIISTEGSPLNTSFTFTDFSIESARKLNTARSIWGQSFNGTANVSGAFSGATTGVFSSTVQATTAILTNLTANYLPKHTATGLVNSSIYNDSNGNIGIGTTSPIAKLQVSGGNIVVNRPSNKVDNSSVSEFPAFEINNSFASGQAGYVRVYYPSYNNLLFGADYDGIVGGTPPNIQFGRTGNPYLTVVNNGIGIGNVGIGTTNPLYKLDVNGTINSPNLRAPMVDLANGWDLRAVGVELHIFYNGVKKGAFTGTGFVSMGEVSAYA